ncbi:MAG: glycosyltransferase family 2 protein [Promethearchaeota archaeon]
MEKVSILMPNFNHEKHLKGAILSCLNQTYNNIELIIADSSTDGSVEILKEFENMENVEIYHDKSGTWTLPQKLNFLVSKAKGDYIKFFWSDDIMREDCIEKNIKFAKKHDLDFVNIDMNWMNYEGKIIRKNINKEIFHIKSNLISKSPEANLRYFIKYGARGPFAIGPNSLFAKKKSLEKLLPFNENFIQEDVPFVYKMHSKRFKIGYINEPLWNFRYFEKINTSDLQGQRTEEHFKMRIYCMRLALASGFLDKESARIAKKRIKTYRAEIFLSKHKFLGLFLLFIRRYQPILVKYHLLLKRKPFNIQTFLKFTITDFLRRVKMLNKGIRIPQCYY